MKRRRRLSIDWDGVSVCVRGQRRRSGAVKTAFQRLPLWARENCS